MNIRKFLPLLFSLAIAISLSAPAGAQSSEPPQGEAGPPPGGPSAPLSPEQMQQLVAPIALYPDTLVAQILAAATYPTQIVEAERFVEQNPGLTGEALANAVNEQNWAPSVKALTAFPQVLSDMNQNLSWTSELGDVNASQPEDVMNAIQDMRQQAQQAGTLQTTSQQTVNNDNGGIAIEPTNPDEVYVPNYDPEYAYGTPVEVWPGMYPWWTTGGTYISFGLGVPMRPWYGYGWACHHWRLGWGPHPGVWFDRGRWHSAPYGYYDRRQYERGEYRGYRERGRGEVFEHGRGGYEGRGNEYTHARPGMPSGPPGDYRVGRGGEQRGYGHSEPGMHSRDVGGAIGGEAHGHAGRGEGGYHGGGGAHGGAGAHGGGGDRGGGGRGGGGERGGGHR